jgi:hypothetical protein
LRRGKGAAWHGSGALSAPSQKPPQPTLPAFNRERIDCRNCVDFSGIDCVCFRGPVGAPAGQLFVDVEWHHRRRRAADRSPVHVPDPRVDVRDEFAYGVFAARSGDKGPSGLELATDGSAGGRNETPSSRNLRLTHHISSSGWSRSAIGLPLPGRPSKAPRDSASRICRSIHDSHLTPGGLRSVTPARLDGRILHYLTGQCLGLVAIVN